ncbi:hypothetical protein A6X21_20310 [Planctopirus hydrillae]|uniref:Uncharacterized protein n=1 Tax=Planctopirus hydrillae TaxID=1841610 RepID=A0A1C3EHH1_9PLAN|nr:hypothetical protein A6X21_20310 [Planctopirus hydrillae]
MEVSALTREIAGYLNLSGGRRDTQFLMRLNQLARLAPQWKLQQKLLNETLETCHRENVTGFENIEQGQSAISLAFDHVFPAYVNHHQDLLGHLEPETLQLPFFLGRIFESILEQGGPWNEEPRIVDGSLRILNDFLGYRPIALLENQRKLEPYANERFCPLPLYIKGAGVGESPYREIIEKSLELLSNTTPEILTDAWFYLTNLDELSLDPRAHDHLHPANKRTNYLFGEWDPHLIDLHGMYRRFVVRKVILDALLKWMSEQKKVPHDELVYDAAAVLAGTILMASAISGAGPETHDSTITLTSLLPRVARQRDRFYATLLENAEGARAKRLQKQAKVTQQPFGHVRQHLNMYLAEYGAQQVQRRHLAYLFARMGYADEARRQAGIIPAAAARFDCEIQWRFTFFRKEIEKGDLDQACRLIDEIEGFLHRGIRCGAIVDPWNILGFQGHFPLFSSREDSVPDQRVEQLLNLVELILEAYAIALQDAAVRGRTDRYHELKRKFSRFAEWWDRFGTPTVADLPLVQGQESYDSALHVAETLSEWRSAGEAAGDVQFWRQHVDRFESSKAYAQVVESLLDRKDTVASLGLLIQWLSQVEEVGLESGPHSLFGLMVDWLELALDSNSQPPQPQWKNILRMFDSVEANAGELWTIPRLSTVLQGGIQQEHETTSGEDDTNDADSTLFGAAYDGMVFRDTANDGLESDTADSGGGAEPGEFEVIETLLEPRLKFARMMTQMWQIAASECTMAEATQKATSSEETSRPAAFFPADHVEEWLKQCVELQQQLKLLMDDLEKHGVIESSGDHEANIEFDMQIQTKFYLLQSIIYIQISAQVARWCLEALLAETTGKIVASDHEEQMIVESILGILRRDPAEVRKLLPALLKELQKRPLLYIPLEHDGDPGEMLNARIAQAIIRFMLCHLPRLGLLKETWHLLQAAHEMERSSRPAGMAVTEFDRLFRIALRNSLESIIHASRQWQRGKFADEDLIEIVGSTVEHYLDQWLDHSSTMRLSTVESLKMDGVWDQTREFIKKYGNEFLNARVLTLGNLRTILHQGIEKYLAYLEESEDPLHPIPLLEDIRGGKISTREASETLRLIYQVIVDRFDRFLEYNSTTTQSDYGQLFFSLLDFLRLETSYERDAWNLLPVAIAHEVLTRQGREEAAEIWEEVFTVKTEDMSERHLAELKKLERQYGMRLPSVTSHLQERFVKPLAVNNMLALIPRAVEEAKKTPMETIAIRSLVAQIEEYLKSSLGSGLDVPHWLRALEEELNEGISHSGWTGADAEPELNLLGLNFTLREMRQQLKTWKAPPGGRKKNDSGNA